MSREYKSKAKKYKKMSRGGLVERDAVTGKERRVSKRVEDFSLKKDNKSRQSLKSERKTQSDTPKRNHVRYKKRGNMQVNSRDKPKVVNTGDLRVDDRVSEAAEKTEQFKFKAVHKTNDSAENSAYSDSKPQPLYTEPRSRFEDKPQKLKLDKPEQMQNDGIKPDKKLSNLQQKSEKATERLGNARSHLPKNRSESVAPQAKQQAKQGKLQFDRESIPSGAVKQKTSVSFAKRGISGVTTIVGSKLHYEAHKIESDNVGVEAAHRAEQTVEVAYHGGKSITRSALQFAKDTPYRKTAQLEKKAADANIKYEYSKYKRDNPGSNAISRYMQKQGIKRRYAKATRRSASAGNVAYSAGRDVTVGIGKRITQKAIGIIRNNPIAASIIALVLMLAFLMSSLFTSCSNMGGGGLSAIIASSYLTQDSDIDSAELSYTEWETDLMILINNIESDYPGYDEYRIRTDNIGHNPYELMAFLTAVYRDFNYSNIAAVLQEIFSEQYQLTFEEIIETRYYEDENGELIPYEWRVLEVNLTSQSFTDVILPRMDTEQRMIYGFLMQTKGNRQYLDSPFDFNWLPYITSYYGWRIHPISGVKDYHMGIDIGVPTGTDIHAGHDGTVTFAGDNGGYGLVVVIEDNNGLVSKYAHCDNLLVSVGQEVEKGDIIAKSGNTGNSTGAHLHLEVIKDGINLNPLFFAQTNDFGYSPVYGNPGVPMGDGNFAALIAEAEKHLGKKYVWGASGPDSFDCSGFIWYVYNTSGTASFGRTTAQGLYNMCTPISPEEALPGDLIFLTGTYSSANPITHVAIYVGNGMVIHAGSPVQYTSINSDYWQSHMFGFGRLN